MDVLAETDVFLFEEFRFDRRGLFRVGDAGNFVPVPVGSRALDILGVLIAQPGKVVAKDEIITSVWPGTIVEDSNLAVQISTLRRVLDRDRPDGSWIQNVPGRGYRFVAPVTRGPAGAQPPSGGSLSTGALPPPRLSIVVLPFADLTNNAAQQYFADAITDDVTTDLSRLIGMFVISRNTAFTYRDRPVSVRQIGRELGVHYLLEGSVRRFGNRFRVNTQLIDTETEAHLWADRIEGDACDPFSAQSEITSRIAVALDVEIVNAEAARTRVDPDAFDCIVRGRAAKARPPSPENLATAIREFERALVLDPASVEAKSRLASAIVDRILDFRSASAEAELGRAEELAGQAVAASPRNAVARYAKGQVLRCKGRYEEAIVEYEAALAFNRNWISAFAVIGRCKIYLGLMDEAIAVQEQAIRLSPRDPYIANWYYRIGQAHLLQGRVDEAARWFERACAGNPTMPFLYAYLASAYGLRGESERAAEALAEARRLSDDDLYSSVASLREHVSSIYFVVPSVRAMFEQTYFAGLRKAGMPG